jgi:predicted nucleic acid-binding Zn ribbon protein
MIHEFRCPKCNNIFEAEIAQKFGGRYKLIYRDNKVFRKLKDGSEIENIEEPITSKCPKCDSISNKILKNIRVKYSDNIIPGSGFATVDKRHSDGMYWDAKKSVARSKKINQEMKHTK